MSWTGLRQSGASQGTAPVSRADVQTVIDGCKLEDRRSTIAKRIYFLTLTSSSIPFFFTHQKQNAPTPVAHHRRGLLFGSTCGGGEAIGTEASLGAR